MVIAAAIAAAAAADAAALPASTSTADGSPAPSYWCCGPLPAKTSPFRRQVSTNDDVATQVDTVVQKDWGYNGSFRTFVGYRLCDCCEEIRFTYWNYNNSTHQISPPATNDTQFTGQLEINALNPGETLQANNSLLMNTYDIDYSKCICYGSCDPCSCCAAPWGLRYYRRYSHRRHPTRRRLASQLARRRRHRPFVH